MSLFQCGKCGCIENTACTSGSWSMLTLEPAVRERYRVQLGLRPEEPLGMYCSVCSPVWYTPAGQIGVGPNPTPSRRFGLWHGEFAREFLPKGQFETFSGPGNGSGLKRKGSRRELTSAELATLRSDTEYL